VTLALRALEDVIRGTSWIYIAFAASSVAIAIYLQTERRAKLIYALVTLSVFAILPTHNWISKIQHEQLRQEAFARFERLCKEQSGEKIYQKFANVKSVLVVKPLPPATESDHFNQYWYGDPYSESASSSRGRDAAVMLTLSSRENGELRSGLSFVEIGESKDVEKGYRRIHRPVSDGEKAKEERIERPISRFGVAWEDISTPELRRYWIAASRLSVIDLEASNTVIAERVGFLFEPGLGAVSGQRRPWLSARLAGYSCPKISFGGYSDVWFITRVFEQRQ
jgi:hypothetical protein